MKTADFLNFLNATIKLQKNCYDYEDDAAINGVHFLELDNKLMLLASSQCVFYWEVFSELGGDHVAGMPLADYEAAKSAGLFPCKILYNDMVKTSALLKTVKIKNTTVWLDAIKQDGARGDYGALSLTAYEQFTTDVYKVGAEQAAGVKRIYNSMLRDDKAWAPSTCATTRHNHKSLVMALAWMTKHSDSPHSIYMTMKSPIVNGKIKNPAEFVELRPEGSDEYGAGVMLMRAEPGAE